MRAFAAFAMAGAVALVGCSSQPKPTLPTYEQAAVHPFLQANRDAMAKLLAGLPAADVSPLLVATIVDVNDLRVSSPLGRTLSEQYSSAAAAAGIDVREMKLRGDVFVREQTGELLLSREIKDIARVHRATAVLVGTYSVAGQYVYVNVKLVRSESGQILRGYDYALPMDRDVQRLVRKPTGDY
ncbi:FlgO family outer membrane protein [Tepidimonas sp.]|uniref:FlgO family outer membrane protein n=1 Tax=Tepidimonas sp. TaxID=2002775 RepID=UPI00391C6243